MNSPDNFSNSRIVVAGLGGVGGFLGAALASTWPDVTFFARGKRKEHLKANGLTLKSEFIGDRHVMPALVTDQVNEIGIADILIISVKNYSLEQICSQLSPIVDDHTIIVPVLNGTDPGDRARKTFGKGIVIDSLIYIISGSEPDYTIVQKGDYATLRIGTRSQDPSVEDAVQTVHKLFAPTGVTCIVEDDIEAAIWKKYIFNCAFNIMTAAYSASVGDLRACSGHVTDMRRLLDEACLIARKKQVNIPDDYTEDRIRFFMNLQSPTGTSSMRRDLDAGRPCELETFSGYLLQEAEKYGADLPRTRYYYEMLTEKIKANDFYQKGLDCMHLGNVMDAMSFLGDALYIRRKYYPEDSLRIREIYYALEQCTFM